MAEKLRRNRDAAEGGEVKQEYVNPFLAPARLVWQSELGQSLELASVEAVSHRFTTEDVTAAIGISGQLQGSVLYGFPMGTARAITDTMVGIEVDAFSELALSALGEIANMITGNAATELADIGCLCDISPPIMIVSPGCEISTLGRRQIMVTFSSAVGPLRVRVSLSRTNEPREEVSSPFLHTVQGTLREAKDLFDAGEVVLADRVSR